MKRSVLAFIIFFLQVTAYSQTNRGILTGNLVDSSQKAITDATAELVPLTDSAAHKTVLTDKNGAFTFTNIAFGYYKLRFSFVGFQTLTLDSIWFRSDRYDFNLNDVVMKRSSSQNLQEIVVYAEKPLIQSKDGNITFNAGESALSAGSSASELLQTVPLVSKDPDGKITVKGKEPKILIDDKPVELNLQQLQDLLESMPGSSIEKIEILTNPPPQYANEQGGVINIVTRKGKVGKSGRISVSGGTRGDRAISGNFNYRKNKIAVGIIAGLGYNQGIGNGYSRRENIYADSTNHFNTSSNFKNKNTRPNFRFNLDYDISKLQLLNIVLQYNQNDYDNSNNTEFVNINRYNEVYKLSQRTIHSSGNNYSPAASVTYTLKSKMGSNLRVFLNYSFSRSNSDRDFYQQFLNPDHSQTGQDSTQQQLNNTRTHNYSVRISYDLPLKNKKTFLSAGAFYNRNDNTIHVDASYLKKPENKMYPLDVLSNYFKFHQGIANARVSVKEILKEDFSITAGVAAEQTEAIFNLLKAGSNTYNGYFTLMPFGNINRNWREKLNLTFSYRRTIRRPGINEMNPTVDFSDPYNIRFGNENLEASTAHNFDFVLGKTKRSYFANIGLGYNIVQNVFAQVRTLLNDGKTQITWENISGRKEYELSSWNGYTISKKLRLNASASYTYSQYSTFDKTVRRYRNGGSFTSNVNTNYTPKDVWNFNASFTLNRFANPQGYSKWNTSMNTGIQRKFFSKKLILTFNVIDPIQQQQTRVFTYGTSFNYESFSTTNTRNYRLSITYAFNNAPKPKKPVSIKDLKLK